MINAFNLWNLIFLLCVVFFVPFGDRNMHIYLSAGTMITLFSNVYSSCKWSKLSFSVKVPSIWQKPKSSSRSELQICDQMVIDAVPIFCFHKEWLSTHDFVGLRDAFWILVAVLRHPPQIQYLQSRKIWTLFPTHSPTQYIVTFFWILLDLIWKKWNFIVLI